MVQFNFPHCFRVYCRALGGKGISHHPPIWHYIITRGPFQIRHFICTKLLVTCLPSSKCLLSASFIRNVFQGAYSHDSQVLQDDFKAGGDRIDYQAWFHQASWGRFRSIPCSSVQPKRPPLKMPSLCQSRRKPTARCVQVKQGAGLTHASLAQIDQKKWADWRVWCILHEPCWEPAYCLW